MDKSSTTSVQEIIGELSLKHGADYMTQNRIPPHISISAIVSEDESELIKRTEQLSRTIRRGQMPQSAYSTPMYCFLRLC